MPGNMNQHLHGWLACVLGQWPMQPRHLAGVDDRLPPPVLLPGIVRAQRHGAGSLDGGCLAVGLFWLLRGQQLPCEASPYKSAVPLVHWPL